MRVHISTQEANSTALSSFPSPHTDRGSWPYTYKLTEEYVHYTYFAYKDIYYNIQKHTKINIFRYFIALSVTVLKFYFLASQGLFYHDYRQPAQHTYIGHLIYIVDLEDLSILC